MQMVVLQGHTGVGFNLAVNETPQFEEIYIYDVKGEALADAIHLLLMLLLTINSTRC